MGVGEGAGDGGAEVGGPAVEDGLADVVGLGDGLADDDELVLADGGVDEVVDGLVGSVEDGPDGLGDLALVADGLLGSAVPDALVVDDAARVGSGAAEPLEHPARASAAPTASAGHARRGSIARGDRRRAIGASCAAPRAVGDPPGDGVRPPQHQG